MNGTTDVLAGHGVDPGPLVGLFMRGAFRKQSQQHMQDFNAFAEKETAVREAKG